MSFLLSLQYDATYFESSPDVSVSTALAHLRSSHMQQQPPSNGNGNGTGSNGSGNDGSNAPFSQVLRCAPVAARSATLLPI